MAKKILITGTAGFIGFHLAQKLLQGGDEIVGLDNINNYYDVNLKYARLSESGIKKENIEYDHRVKSNNSQNYSFIKLNLEERSRLFKLFEQENFNIVIHLAAQAGVRYSLENPYAYIDSNIVGFINILEACRHNNIEHLIYASSSSVYGLNEKIPFSTNDNVDHPISLYAATKKSNELMAHTYSHLYNIPATGLRFFTVFGPWGRPDMALFLFTKAILENKPINVFNEGQMMRDFTYIDDIIEGIIRIMDDKPKPDPNWNGKVPKPSTSKAPYKVYNIGNNQPINLLFFIEELEKVLGKKAIKNWLPHQSCDLVSTYADVDDLVTHLGYQPSTPVRVGIENFVKWYKKFYNVPF